ncbi:MAG: DUF3553 domain-containing protein [Vicinamibacteria bacterium]|nr:DUF3553 domain-containing protein [Vicinamibacteria bacterium]
MRMKVGDRVRHTVCSEWGQGQIIEVGHEGRLRVYFTGAGQQFLKAAFVVEVTGADAALPFVIPRAGRRSASSPQPTMADCRRAFTGQYPRGFVDPVFIHHERTASTEASQLLADSLSAANFKALLGASDHSEVCRLARAVVGHAKLIDRSEQLLLAAGLKKAASQQSFSKALYGLLHESGPFEPRFNAFAAVLTDIGAAKWPLATYFSYLMTPKSHILVKPSVIKAMAAICQIQLNYKTQPNWATYASVLRLAAQVSEDLEDLKPKDMIDVQAFMGCVAR